MVVHVAASVGLCWLALSSATFPPINLLDGEFPISLSSRIDRRCARQLARRNHRS